MFGYVKPYNPYLYMKDDTLYKALYCGVCKSIGKRCGQCARFSLTYDITFLSAVIHNLLKVDVKIQKEHCIIHPIIKRPIAKPDDISYTLGCLNVILAYYKAQDDVNDSNKGKFKRLFLSSGFKRAKKACGDLEKIVSENYSKLNMLEKSGCCSIDMISDPFAVMLMQIASSLLKEKDNEYTQKFFYNFGKWIYLIDALDDYDKDIKEKNYNPFYSAYNSKDFTSLKKDNANEISFIMGACLNEIENCLKNFQFGFNADLIRNIATRGIGEKTKEILLKNSKKGNK